MVVISLLAKSSVSYYQLEDRKNKGAKFIELHLNEGDIITKKKRKEIVYNLKKLNLIAKVVHVPIDERFTIEGLLNENGFRVIENTCKLAQEISEEISQEMHIVMHQSLSLIQLKNWGMFEIIKGKMKYLLDTYPNIIINIENLTVFSMDSDKFELRNNYFNENINVCKELRFILKTDRIGTVLDICHAISSIRILETFINKNYHKQIYLRDYFLINKQFLNVIHLSNSIGFGMGTGHGVGFDTKEDLDLLKEILSYVEDINYKNIITLEICEKDYLDTIEYRKTKRQVDEILKQTRKSA